jgi:hypothetical protein
VLAVPYVVMDDIPPRRVLNDVLRKGALDAGMSGGCLWEPFELDESEYRELVRELQRRGTRPVLAGDPGGKTFGTPEPPDTVRTYSEWVSYRSERLLGRPSRLARAEPQQDSASAYEEWLERLPVGDLYLGYLEAIDSEWRAARDDAFDLPAELVSKLRQLAAILDERLGKHPGVHTPEYQDWLKERGTRTARVREELRACVDRLGLPRWPYERFRVG